MARPDWVNLIQQYAPRYGVDPKAALAVAMQEGLSGNVGDSGTSFGPFQLHIGGANPYSDPRQARAFAESPQGIAYALQRMASSGAKGQVGQAAVNSIVRNFERPANPDREVANALRAYGSGAGSSNGRTVGFGPTNLGSSPSPAASSDPRAALLQWVMARNNAFVNGTQAPDLGSFIQANPGMFSGMAPGGSVSLSQALPGIGKGQGLTYVPGALATRAGIQVNSAILGQAESLARQFGVRINSGFRSAEKNASVGGAENSDHLRGNAIDFSGSPAQLQALYKYAQGRFPYVEPMAQAKDHVHISFIR